MVIMAQPFGRVFELWSLDMGLGPVDPQFMAIHEEDLNPEVVNNEDQAVPVVEDGEPMNEDEELVEVILVLSVSSYVMMRSSFESWIVE
ncbi:hypothetical protein ACET3Z_006323 [Daucus carota]